MKLIYRLITMFILLEVIWVLFDEKDVKLKATAAFTIIPLLLRTLMIK
ncbi:hypothetical protein KGY79_12125 [Candidatus Bipolaricaulota bacterium]|nr:hypothetical protein [Candidatus Bipolaricaulota bacterium]